MTFLFGLLFGAAFVSALWCSEWEHRESHLRRKHQRVLQRYREIIASAPERPRAWLQ